MSEFTLLHGDCLEQLKTLADCSVDSLVTDPPAGISFMGLEFDSDKGGRDHWIKWLKEVMQECLRVMKPGAHGLVWAIPRTSHWTATALEDAGFEIRDVVTHLFGSGFPKSCDISKQLDKQEQHKWLDISKAIDNLNICDIAELSLFGRRLTLEELSTVHGSAEATKTQSKSLVKHVANSPESQNAKQGTAHFIVPCDAKVLLSGGYKLKSKSKKNLWGRRKVFISAAWKAVAGSDVAAEKGKAILADTGCNSPERPVATGDTH
jgi:hypothetical protein